MKKAVLRIITVFMLLVVMLSTSVNAATLSTDKATMEKGDIVTVTVTTNEEVDIIEFRLKFDTEKYKFVESSITTDLRAVDYGVKGDTITVSAYDTSFTTKTLSLEFEALENGTNVAFEIFDEDFSNNETVTNPKVEVTIEEEETPVNPDQPETPVNPDQPETPVNPDQPETPVNPDQPETPVNPDQPETPVNPDGDKYIDDDGNEITSIPQAGSLIPSILLGIVILVAVTVGGYKIIKK